MIGMAVRAVLVGDATVNALIGGRCYPVEASQGSAYPYLTYQVVTGDDDYHLGGPSGLAARRVQIDCDAESAMEISALALAVRNALGGFRGPVAIAGLSPPATVTIQGAFKVMERDGDLGELQSSGPRPRRRSIDFNIWFEE